MTQINNNHQIGQIQISDEVISIIASAAAMEVDGVLGLMGNIKGEITEFFSKKANAAKGIKITVTNNHVKIELHLILKFGVKIQEVAVNVQKRVSSAIETMTGLTVENINIFISGIGNEKHKDNKSTKKS